MSSFHEIVNDLLSGQPKQGLRKLQAAARAEAEPSLALLSALRLAIQQPSQTPLYYQKLGNIWQRWGRPPLKPNPMQRKLLLLADSTVDGLNPLLTVFCAAWGIEVEVHTPTFDSIEQLALSSSPGEGVVIDGETTVILLGSERWLARYLGDAALVSSEQLERFKSLFQSVLQGLSAQGPRDVLVSTFSPRTFPLPGGMVQQGDSMGWELARLRINEWLAGEQRPGLHLVDLSEALFLAGGQATLGQRSYFRAKIAWEQAGAVAVCRELASAYANVCGKGHRAVATDWDNTLWGGVVADDGFHGVDVGLDTPDGLAYLRVQEFFKGLKCLGILVAAVSRNPPRMCDIFQENQNLALSLDDFSSVQVSFSPKSESLGRASAELGFGTEFVVFVDDSLFELVESLQVHPYLDVVRAGPEPTETLERLTHSRFWSAVSLSDADLGRAEAAKSLKQQRELRTTFRSVEDFLAEIKIRIEVETLTEANLPRVTQLFQKTNQFNLTTRRHSRDDLLAMREGGTKFGVFSYADSFGSQGIISVVALEARDETMWFESWLMSCRVLNRSVEEAVFCWAAAHAGERELWGECLPTAKNELVRGLYERCGMSLVERDEESGRTVWSRPGGDASPLPTHFAQLTDLTTPGEATQ
jgi:FkbH-like protein